jgi:hypothetical protein
MIEPVSIAQYFPWDGGAIFLGTTAAIPAHAHQAIRICSLFEGRIRLRTNNEEPWTGYALAIVPSPQPHAMDGFRVHYGATLRERVGAPNQRRVPLDGGACGGFRRFRPPDALPQCRCGGGCAPSTE